MFDSQPPALVEDVVKSISAVNISDAYGLCDPWGSESMISIMNEIMMEIAGNDYNPWPDLTRGELSFLIGDRFKSRHCPFPLFMAVRYPPVVELTFFERVAADRHRSWLEKGAEAKRKRLAKAQAEIVKLTRRAGLH